MAVQQYVLDGDGHGSYRFVVHYLTPAGNNAVGTAWSAAVVNSGRATTILATGTGAGQIATADAAAIAAGTMVEVVASFNTAGFAQLSPAAQQAVLNTLAAQLIADSKATLQVALNFFGFTQGAAS